MDTGHASGGSRTSREARPGRLGPGYTWEDLVLPEAELERLRSISRYLRTRERHVSGQGAETSIRRMPVRPVLFLGAGGTGKTLAAQIVAADVNLPVQALDLADALTFAEYEFERIAARAFQIAAREGAILVVYGAETLLRRSAAGQKSLRRLLRRADGFDGLVIFTSTVTHGIDPAVTDRFHAVVTFPLPETEARKEIWRRSLPADAQLTDSDLDYLAGRLQEPGGTIHRCCLAAADLAAREGLPVQLRHVTDVLDQEYDSGGRPAPPPTPPPAPIRSGSSPPPPGPINSDTAVSPPAPVRSGPSFGRRWPLVAAGVLIAAVVIGAMVVLMTPGTSRPGTIKAGSVDAVRMSLPSNWRPTARAAPPSLGLTRELAVVSPAPAGGELVIGEMAADDASPLPPPLLATLPAAVTPQIVKVGRLVFYRYPGSRPAGGSVAQTIYAVPTTTGTVVGVCRPQRSSSSFASSCERVLGTLQLTSGRALPLTLSTSYARELSGVITRLNAVRSSAGPRLATATSAHAQAAAAAQLAQAHNQAASALVHLGAGRATAANVALAHALLQSANAYSALAHAASHSDAHAYRTARADLASSAQALSLAFDQLRRLGYQVA